MSGRAAQDLIVERCLRDAERQGVSLRTDAMALERISKAAETAVNELRNTESTDVNLPFIGAATSGPIHLHFVVRRADLAGAALSAGPVVDPRVKLGG